MELPPNTVPFPGLTPRLAMIAERVRVGARVADIGTDHAYLPVYLVREGIAPSAVAADLRPGPLENARLTVRRHGLEDRIRLCLSDGLEHIAPEEADDIVLAGMGGTLIVSILKKAPWVKDEGKRLLLQPMSRSEEVREYLHADGFELMRECACTEAAKSYAVLCARYTGQPPAAVSAAFRYIGLLPQEHTEAARVFIRKQAARLNKRLNGLLAAGGPATEIDHLQTVLKEIAEVLDENPAYSG